MQHLAGRNQHAGSTVCFLGGGSHHHLVPAAVESLLEGEFSYRDAIPRRKPAREVSEAFFEFQTLICQLHRPRRRPTPASAADAGGRGC